jgi:para-nitrobenzyl esterase
MVFYINTVLLAAISTALSSDVVHTEDGALRGVVTSRYRSFQGVPYAAPPLGRLRWAPPDPVVPWKGIRDARAYQHNCLQSSDFDPAQPRDTLSEDCLYLNVFTPPNASATSRLPVFFYVHGGSYQNGGSNESRLNGTWNAAQRDVVVVTINYRLNVFGFLASKSLRNRDPANTTGAYGILDQRAALAWVQRNIEGFGGDPARVMLTGESAGGASVYNHLVRPASWGLFARAVPESGGYTLILPQPTSKEYEADFMRLMRKVGCASIACLEVADGDALVRAAVELDFEPVVDGVDLSDQISELLSKGRVAPGVPIMAGATREDLAYPIWAAPDATIDCEPASCTQADFAAFVQKLRPTFGWNASVAQLVTDAYGDEIALPGGSYSRWYWAAHHLGSDYTMICPARRSVAAVASAHGGASTGFLYLFSHAPDGPSGAYPSLAHHASEIPFVFHDNSAVGPNAPEFHISRREWPLADAMAGAWAEFAATGRPRPSWPPYTQDEAWMVFGATAAGGGGGNVTHQLKSDRCSLWDATGEASVARFNLKRARRAASVALRRSSRPRSTGAPSA